MSEINNWELPPREERPWRNEAWVFDWDKAARIIRDRKPLSAVAGLERDWPNVAVEIYREGKIEEYDDDTMFMGYRASMWDVPLLRLYFSDKHTEDYVCYVTESQTEWDVETWWPQSARDIMEGKDEGPSLLSLLWLAAIMTAVALGMAFGLLLLL